MLGVLARRPGGARASEVLHGRAPAACATVLLVRSPLRLRWLSPALVALLSCSGDDAGEPAAPRVWVDVGLPGGADGLEFVALEPGGEVPLQTFGQGGTHALLAVRCGGLGNAAFVGVEIENLASGDAVNAPPSASPRLLLCRESQVCDLLPLLVMTGGLVPPGTDRDGLAVHIRVDASNTEGLSASVERDAVLSTAALR
jgi:hypothetical protein